MASHSEPGDGDKATAAIDDSLQFETAVPRGAAADVTAVGQGVTCVACQTAITGEYFDVNGQSVCASCRERLEAEAETPRGSSVFARAGVFGSAAAILGAILYYAVIAITDFEIGLVAIAIGYMVGYGVRRGTKGRGGRRFQVLALVLTYWAVGLAYTPFVFRAQADQPEQEAGAAAAASSPEAADAPGDLNVPLAAAILLGLSFALPVMVVAGSLPGGLISAAIIAFGMQQAWRMTAPPILHITGPYRVGAVPALSA